MLFSHYHPHYSGGLRAFLAAGATVVTTPGNEELVRAIAARAFTHTPDRLAREPSPVLVELFEDRWTLDDGRVRIEAIDVGMRSKHTTEYVLFHLPRQGLLFQGDLGWYPGAWFPDGGDELRAGSRAAALVAILDEEQLEPERIVQSWPAVDVPMTRTPAELRALVEERSAR